jgi:hypothetical protein
VRDRVILAVKFTPAGSGSQVQKAVGGFLRYVQHRDFHPTQPESRPNPEVSGLLKYVAYREHASTRAELFGPSGPLGNAERKAFAGFVAGAIEGSRPQLYRGGDGEMRDRRRAVYRMVISPERADGLDLRRLTTAAVERLEQESGMGRLRWIAAIHRNTAHHHVHLVLAGMREDGNRGFARVDITKLRLAAMKEALGLEIERQRAERAPSREQTHLAPPAANADATNVSIEARPTIHLVSSGETVHLLTHPKRVSRDLHPTPQGGSLIALRAVARRYQRQMERELAESYRQSQWEHVA